MSNRLKNKGKRKKDYISQIFNFYCDDLKQVKISMSLMGKSYKTAAEILIDKKAAALDVEKIVKMVTSCEKMTISDGYKYEMIPINMDYENTILGMVEDALVFVNKIEHPLKDIILEMNP